MITRNEILPVIIENTLSLCYLEYNCLYINIPISSGDLSPVTFSFPNLSPTCTALNLCHWNPRIYCFSITINHTHQQTVQHSIAIRTLPCSFCYIVIIIDHITARTCPVSATFNQQFHVFYHKYNTFLSFLFLSSPVRFFRIFKIDTHTHTHAHARTHTHTHTHTHTFTQPAWSAIR